MIGVAAKKSDCKTGGSQSTGGTFFKGTEHAASTQESSFFPPAVQAKKEKPPQQNKFEKEADAIADKVVNAPAKEHTCNGDCDDVTVQQKTNGSDVQAKCAACEEEKSVQRKVDISAAPPKGGGNMAASKKSFSQQLNAASAGGHSLDADTATSMGGKLNADLGNVKIHTDEQAAALSSHINAQAFTKDNHVFFNKNKFNPSTREGKHLLAHELAHTVQQGAVSQNKQKKTAKPEDKKPRDEADFKKQKAVVPEAKQKPIVDISKDYEAIDPAKQAALPGAADAIIKEASVTGAKGGTLQGMPGADKLKPGSEKGKKEEKKDAGKQNDGKDKEQAASKAVMTKLTAKQGVIKTLNQPLSFKDDEKIKDEKPKDKNERLKNKFSAEGHANEFIRSSSQKIQQVFAAGQAVHPVINTAASAAKINVRSQMQQQLAKIKAEHAKLQKQAKAKAGSTFGTINAQYKNAVAQANKTAGDAKKALETSFKAESERLETAYKAQLPTLDSIYTTAADKFRKAGVTAGDYAVSQANSYASIHYDPHVTGIDDNLLDGPYTSDQYEARAKAAREVGKQYRDAEKGLVNAGKEQADKLLTGPGKGKDLQVINENVEKSRQSLKQNYEAAVKNVDTSLKQTLDQAKKIKTGLTQAASKTFKATKTGLGEQEKAMTAQVLAIGEGQLANIDKEAMMASSSLANATIDTIDLLVKGVNEFKRTVKESKTPAAGQLKEALMPAGMGFGNATSTININFRKGAMQASMAIVKAAKLTVQEMQQLTETGIAQSNEIYDGLPPVMNSLIANAISSFKGLSKGFTENTDKAVTASTKGFKEIADGIDKFFTAYYKSLTEGLDTSSKDIEKAFKESVDGPDFISTIKTEAQKAAKEVSPRWKSVLKVLLVILVVVLVALVIGPAVIGFVTAGAAALGAGAAAATIGAVVGGAIVGAAAGAVIQMGNNIIDGKPLFEGVAKAAIIGAVSGALGGAGGALGQFITKGAQGLAPALIRFGVDMAFDVGGNIAIEAYEAFKDGRAINWGEIAKGAAISGAMSIGMGNINKLGKFGAKVEGIQGKTMAFGEGLGGKVGTKIKTTISVDAPAAPKVPNIEAPAVKIDSPDGVKAPEPVTAKTTADAPKVEVEAPKTPKVDSPDAKLETPGVTKTTPDAAGPKVEAEAPKGPKTEGEVHGTKTDADIKAKTGDADAHGPKTEGEVKGKVTDEAKAKVDKDPAEVKQTSETNDAQQKMQNDETTVNKTKTDDGHELKVDEHGNIVKCSECQVYELTHKQILDENPELADELKAIRKKMTDSPDDPKVMDELKAFDQKMKEIDSFAKAKKDLLNNQKKIDEEYDKYLAKKRLKNQNPRKKDEWLKGKMNDKTGKTKGGFENTLKGRVGEHQADMHLNDNGFKKLSNDGKLVDYNDAPQGKGLDGVWEKDGVLYVSETKYGSAKLKKGQMSDSWITDNVGYLKPDGLSDKVLLAMKNGTLKKILVHVDDNGIVTKTML